MSRTALLTIDVQNDFVQDGPAYVDGTAERLPQIARLLAMFRAVGAPIIHVIRLYAPDGSDAEPLRRDFIRDKGPVVAAGTLGAALPPALGVAGAPDGAHLYAGRFQQTAPSEWLMYKPRWDAFHATGLEAHLRGLGVDTVAVCGCNLPNCPRATLFGASNRDFRTILVQDATSQATPERLADLALMGTQVLSVAQMAQAIGG